MIPRRQPTYEDNLSEDEDDAETMLQGNRRGGQREPDRKTSVLKPGPARRVDPGPDRPGAGTGPS